MPRPKTINFGTVHRFAAALIDSHIWPTRRLVRKGTGGGSETVSQFLKQLDLLAMWKMKWGDARPPRMRSRPPVQDFKTQQPDKEITLLRQEIAELGRLMDLLRTQVEHPKQPEENAARDAELPPSDMLPSDHPLFGLSIPDAAAKQLAMLGEDSTLRQITAALLKSGYKISSDPPENAVRQGLKRRAARQGDVVLVGRGKWGMMKWYSPDRLNDKLSNLGGEPGRDFEHHRMRVLSAQELSRQMGVRYGRATFEELYPYEKIEEFRRLRAAGTPLPNALSSIGMPRGTYNKYKSAINGHVHFGTQETFLAEAERIRVAWPN